MEPFPGEGELDSLGAIARFLNRVGGFHDGVVKEVHWINLDFVGADLSMLPYQGAQCRMLVQRQWADPSAVELTLFGVQLLHMDTRDFVFTSDVEEREKGFSLKIGDVEIVFERARYRFASEWMGDEIRFGLGLQA